MLHWISLIEYVIIALREDAMAMNRRRAWKKAQRTPEEVKTFLTKLIRDEQKWAKTGYSDGSYARRPIEETLETTEDAETRAVLLECLKLCASDDPFKALSFSDGTEEKICPIYWEPGEFVKFGRYPQRTNSRSEPIEWIVLGTDYPGSRLLLSRYGLEAKPYNDDYNDVTWKDCTLRKWLNSEFYETAFTEEEKARIALSYVQNDDNPKYRTKGGADTQDYVYLLSFKEVQRYFTLEGADMKKGFLGVTDDAVCMPTRHAVDNGASALSEEFIQETQSVCGYELRQGACWWWLRSPGRASSDAALVFVDGSVLACGRYVDYDIGCVRPVIELRLF